MGIEFALWGLGGAVATSLVMELLKRVWLGADGKPVLQDRWAVLASVIVGILLSVAAYLGGIYPAVQTVLEVIGAGFLAGLAACGLYSAAKQR